MGHMASSVAGRFLKREDVFFLHAFSTAISARFRISMTLKTGNKMHKRRERRLVSFLEHKISWGRSYKGWGGGGRNIELNHTVGHSNGTGNCTARFRVGTA